MLLYTVIPSGITTSTSCISALLNAFGPIYVSPVGNGEVNWLHDEKADCPMAVTEDGIVNGVSFEQPLKHPDGMLVILVAERSQVTSL